MSAKCFETVQGMSDYQAERELQEALRVQQMSPEARWMWLQQSWRRLQDGGAFLWTDDQPMPDGARCYATLDEKTALMKTVKSGKRSRCPCTSRIHHDRTQATESIRLAAARRPCQQQSTAACPCINASKCGGLDTVAARMDGQGPFNRLGRRDLY